MSTRRYRVREDKHPEVAGYALEVLIGLAAGHTYPPVETAEQAREYVQGALDRMVAEGYIEPRDEVQP